MLKNARTKPLLMLTLGLAVAAPVGLLLAHDGNATTGIYKTRHDEYHKLGAAFKTLRDETKAGSPDMAKIKSAVQVVSNASVNQFNWFPVGSGPQPGHKTRAKPDIWSNAQGFASAQNRLKNEAAKLLAASNSGDLSAIKAQYAETGKACKNCHDTFRAPEEDEKH